MDIRAEPAPAAPLPTSIDYPAWVLAAVGVAPVSTAPLVAPAGVVILEKPVGHLVKLAADLRAKKAKRILCGFLPDEADARGTKLDADLAFLVERMEFVPFRFTFDQAVGPGRGIVVVATEPAKAGKEGSVLALVAPALSDATGKPLTWIDPARGGLAEMARAIAGASVVVNGTADWSLGFAIDELAARLGRGCVRLHNPGYSPLRYALLGQRLPPAAPLEVARLREWLVPAISAKVAKLDAKQASWFSAGSGSDRWRALFNPNRAAAFWRGADAASLSAAALREPSRWTNRTLGWPAWLAVQEPGLWPAPAVRATRSTLAEWLRTESAARLTLSVRDAGLARALRLRPDFLEELRGASPATEEFRAALESAVVAGAEWEQSAEPVAPLLEAARPIVRPASGGAAELQLYFAWRENWPEIPARLTEGVVVPPVWRRNHVEAVLARLGDARPASPVSDPAGGGALLQDAHSWTVGLGAAGVFLQVLGALRAGRRDWARGAWRRALAARGRPWLGGTAPLLRAAWGDSKTASPWLRQIARFDDPRALDTAVLWQWHTRRSADLWRKNRPARIERELAVARAVVEADAGIATATSERRLQRATLLALSGASEAALEVLRREVGEPAGAGPMAGVIALGLWCRGDEPAARAALDLAPLGPRPGAWAVFLQAVAQQLLGRRDAAAEALRVLARLAPGYLSDPVATDARWMWATVVFRRGGWSAEAERCGARATVAGVANESLWSEIVTVAGDLTDAWGLILTR